MGRELRGDLESMVRSAGSEPLLCIDFGIDGDDTFYLGAGWSGGEPGCRWEIGGESELWTDNPGTEGDSILEFDVAPFAVPPMLPSQHLSVFVRGALVGRIELVRRSNPRVRIPASVFEGRGPVKLLFEHPDAARPSDLGHGQDDRLLAVCFRRLCLSRVVGDLTPGLLIDWKGVTPAEVEQRTGLSAAELMLKFESIGDNCEFGLVQRRCAAEPLGLLRFSNLELRRLILGLRRDFQGLGDVQHLEFWLSDGERREYVIRDREYGLVFHTFLYENDVAQNALLPQQAGRLKFLCRKFLEDLRNGEKILVCKRNDELSAQDVLALHAELNRYGPNTLLWVTTGEGNHTPGTVDRVMPGLLRGYIDRFAPYENAHDLSLEVWLSICVNAFLLSQ